VHGGNGTRRTAGTGLGNYLMPTMMNSTGLPLVFCAWWA
jgi:hypothetical protein